MVLCARHMTLFSSHAHLPSFVLPPFLYTHPSFLAHSLHIHHTPLSLPSDGSIHCAFSKKKHLQTDMLLIAHLLQQLLSAVNHLHQKKILHRDIKGTTHVYAHSHTQHTQHKSVCYSFPPSLSPFLPSLSAGQNLLLFHGCVCKLADFGMAVHLDDCQEVRDDGVKGTYPFLSPEVRAP